MTPISLTAPSAAFFLSTRPVYIPSLKPICSRYNQLKKLNQRRRARNGKCRAEFSADAPVAIAIGACVLTSLILTPTPLPEDSDGDSLIDSADARFAVMGIISLIPYFNWMSWVFAWLDTGKRRYAFYAIVYLAPYLSTFWLVQREVFTAFLTGMTYILSFSAVHSRHVMKDATLAMVLSLCQGICYIRWSKLSLSPEESWLPIASILIGIIHIQLEASIKNGDIKGFQIFNEGANYLWSIKEKKNKKLYDEGGARDSQNLPSANEQSRSDIRNWGLPKKPAQDHKSLDQDGETHSKS